MHPRRVYLCGMNYLAHAYLSFGEPARVVGNLIGDFVKGNQHASLPKGISEGVRLHRAIDAFTDRHEATIAASACFRETFGRYAPVFVDVVYDHFLAADEGLFSEASLHDFSTRVYDHLESHKHFLPEQFVAIYPRMRAQNWLFHYRSEWGLEKSFGGLIHRAAYLSKDLNAMDVFRRNRSFLQGCYKAFIPDVTGFARSLAATEQPFQV